MAIGSSWRKDVVNQRLESCSHTHMRTHTQILFALFTEAVHAHNHSSVAMAETQKQGTAVTEREHTAV